MFFARVVVRDASGRRARAVVLAGVGRMLAAACVSRECRLLKSRRKISSHLHPIQAHIETMDRSSSFRELRAAAARSGTRRSRVAIDLRAHGPALEALAQSRHIPLAVLMRAALAEWLKSHTVVDGTTVADASPEAPIASQHEGSIVKVTLRMPARSATRLAREAYAAEAPQGLFVARLLEGLPPVPVPADLEENRRALMASTVTLAALLSDLRALERGLSRAGREDLAACVAEIRPVSEAVSRHLEQASALLAELAKSRRRPSVGAGAA